MTRYKSLSLSKGSIFYEDGTAMNNKVLSTTEFAILKKYLEDMLAICEADEDIDIEIGAETRNAASILGIYSHEV